MLPSYRANDVRIVFKKLVENFCRATGRSNGADGEVEGGFGGPWPDSLEKCNPVPVPTSGR